MARHTAIGVDRLGAGALLLLLLCHAASPNGAAASSAAASSSRKLLSGDDAVTKRLEGDCESTEVHIAIADDQKTIRVAWRTLGRDCGSTVYYGELDGSSSSNGGVQANRTLLREVLGTTYSLTEGIMCTAPARKQPFVVTMHVAHLTDLEPDTPYWYRMAGSSREFSFRSPVAIGPGRSRKFSFIAYGDMGESVIGGRKSPMAARTMSTIMGELERGGPSPVDLVLHVGDLAYADGSHKIWDSFMTAIEPLASRIPYMVGIGNHEYDFIGPADNDPSGVTEPYHPMWGNFGSESGGECGAMTAKRFLMPAVRTATDNPPFWYSFDYGLVHFTMISTEHDISPGSMQYRWLARDLASVDRCVTPWLVVGMHRPFYVVYPHKDNRVVGDHLRDFIEDLLLEYQVDLTLAGHVHTYYRTCDVREERCTEDGSGVVHFVIGTAGHKLSDITDEQRDWLDGDINDWGFVRFDVDDDTMRASFILSRSGEVADSTKLVTRIYTEEECVDLRAKRPAQLAALEQRLTTLQAEHAVRSAEEALLKQQLQQEQQQDLDGAEDREQQQQQEEGAQRIGVGSSSHAQERQVASSRLRRRLEASR